MLFFALISIPVTVVTQASVDRLSQLEAQCRSWNGRLSAVIYTSVTQASYTGDLNEVNQDVLARVAHDVEQFASRVGLRVLKMILQGLLSSTISS